jgi:hypothetical protein
MTEPWAAWTPEPDDTAKDASLAPGGFAGVFAAVRPAPGERPGALERARWARDEPDPEPADLDERAANLMARRYAPGQLSDLSQRLAEVTGELEAEREKIAAGERHAARIERMRAAGQLGALEAWQRLDGDFGDQAVVERLERRQASLRRQLEGASMTVTPAPALDDPLASAQRAAHAAFTTATWQAITAVQEGRAPAPGPRPFAGPGAGDAPDCPGCAAAGASRSESAQIHAEARRDAAAAASPYWPGDVITTGYEGVR